MTLTHPGLDTLEAALAVDDGDLYRVLFTGRPTWVRSRIWYLSGPTELQLIVDHRWDRSVDAARTRCQDIIDAEQAAHAGGRPAAITWVNRVTGAAA